MITALWRCVARGRRLLGATLLALMPLSLGVAQSASTAAGSAGSDSSLYRLVGRWTNYDGRAVPWTNMQGEVVVVAMVYTSCTMTCPLITREMLAVQRALPPAVRPKVRFVLASFDPARDSVGALRRHAEKMALDDRWLVMRGSASDARQLAVLLGVSYRQLPSGDFDHSNIISVLDPRGVLHFQSPRIPADRAALVRAVTSAARPPAR